MSLGDAVDRLDQPTQNRSSKQSAVRKGGVHLARRLIEIEAVIVDAIVEPIHQSVGGIGMLDRLHDTLFAIDRNHKSIDEWSLPNRVVTVLWQFDCDRFPIEMGRGVNDAKISPPDLVMDRTFHTSPLGFGDVVDSLVLLIGSRLWIFGSAAIRERSLSFAGRR